mgnify:CR=1 FL=1
MKELENLTPEEFQKKLLATAILNNKRLKSIDYTLSFIGVVVLISVFIAVIIPLFGLAFFNL